MAAERESSCAVTAIGISPSFRFRGTDASCSERELVENGGRVGATLYALSRAGASKSTPSLSGGRKPITLSTKPLSVLAPLEDELDDDSVEAVPA